MLDRRTELLVSCAAYASRPIYREELSRMIAAAKESGIVVRTELYEALIQNYLFAGFPSGLEGARALSKNWPEEETAKEERAQREAMSYTTFLERGQALYQTIYSKNADTVRSEMLKLSPELAAWAVIEGYGKTLSRPQLDVKTRELCIVSVLTQLGWERQLFSHIMGALNVEASPEEVTMACFIGAMGDEAKSERAGFLLAKAVVK